MEEAGFAEEYEVKKGESNLDGGREGKERKRERRGHGTGNKRMVLKSWRRAALSLYRRQLERGVVI